MPTLSGGTPQFVEVTQTGPVLVAGLVGPSVSEREVSIIQSQVTGSMDAADGFKYLVLDMRRVDFMPSVGIGMRITLQKQAKDRGGSSLLLGLSDDLMKIFKLMNLQRVFKIVKDEDELRKAME